MLRRPSFAMLLLLALLALIIPPGAPLFSQDEAPSPTERADAAGDDKGKVKPQQKLFTGKVVLLGEALKRRGIAAYDEIEDQAALETPDGELIPIIPDWRGRAFFQDERLRNRKVDLIGYRREGIPYLQVLMVFTYNEKGERQYTDYWCDICAIPMYEIKACECCQGPIDLRFQPRSLPDYLTKRPVSPKSKDAE